MPDYSTQPNWTVACVDARSFFASCEAAARGLDPRTCLLAVVSDPDRSGSVVLAASPALKARHGIKTGSRLYEIPRDPAIVLAGARMAHYLEVSTAMTGLLHRWAPPEDILVYSIDEAWIELPDLHGSPERAAAGIQADIERELGIPTAIGIGPNMFLAKAALDNEAKRSGIAAWTYADVPAKLWPVKARHCWGIGPALAERLKQLGIHTVGDLARTSLALLEHRFGVIGNQLYYHAWGIDHSRPRTTAQPPPDSFGKGVTLLRDYKDREDIKTALLELCDAVAERALHHGLAGRTVSLALNYSRQHGGSGFSHAVTLAQATCLPMEIYGTCLQLLERYDQSGAPVRQLYVNLSNLAPMSGFQANLFSDQDRQLRVAQAIGAIRSKHGQTAVQRARNLGAGKTDHAGKIGGHAAGRIGGLKP